MKTIEEKIAVMTAHAEGKEIEYQDSDGSWYPASNPLWNWERTIYRVKPEKKYRPYANAEECYKDVVKHGGWVKDKYAIRHISQITFKLPNGIDNDDFVHIRGCNARTYKELLKGFVWADDKTPCGVLED